jgi:intracellular septation protein A
MSASNPIVARRANPLLTLARGGFHPALWLNVGGPLAAYQVLTNDGASPTNALLVGAAFPLATIGAKALRNRRLDIIGMFSLTAIAIGILGTVLFHNPHILLVKDSFLTAALGLACLGSLFTSRPLLALLAGQFAASTGRTPSTASATALRRLTLVWGCTLLIEAALRVALSFLLPPAILLTISPLVDVAVFGPVAVWTLRRRPTTSPPDTLPRLPSRDPASSLSLPSTAGSRPSGRSPRSAPPPARWPGSSPATPT